MKRLIVGVLVFALTGFSTFVHAALYDRGGGLIYDDVLKVTWLQDANYAMTSGYSTTGVFGGMTARGGLTNAETWAANLVYAGYTGWRLPQALPVNGTAYNYLMMNDGSADNGYNISAPGSAHPGSRASELSYMFYVNLGNKGYLDISGNPQSDSGLKNTGYFINIQNGTYWMDTAMPPDSMLTGYFNFTYGNQFVNNTARKSSYAWALHDGDIGGASTPLPGAMLLFASGLTFLMGLRRRFHKKA